MKYKLGIAYVLALATFLVTCNSSKELDIWKVYYFGGQSNMDGYGFNDQLSDSLKRRISNSMIFNGKRDNKGSILGGIGVWAPVDVARVCMVLRQSLWSRKCCTQTLPSHCPLTLPHG